MRSFGFSTLGCPGLDVDTVLAMARRHGADLVQLRCAPDEPVNTGLSGAGRADVVAAFATAGVGFGALATYVKLSDPDMLRPLDEHIALAVDLGAPALRLFPGDVAVETGTERLHRAEELAAGTGVVLTVETHDEYLRGAQIAQLLAETEAVKAVWDVLHTWRAGETVANSLAALGPYLAELQIKDVPSAEDRRPLAPGTGVLPLREALEAVAAAGIEVPVIFEHEAKWRADADPFEESLAAAVRLAKASG
ncbi:sugar phosphate isomerase/epimerase family protein [Stackebrandtia nassauensis]|uniref:Xylose isomerase domain protein TIM barrel n=1 Tax=Stackebrandtia nassauensis (strain DSM 44728 / CIP 108903 / NRRL B-16338 / NBRC 102104 / LLR-40K-21) TaxID=446470 RepID=D3QA38_STANL|nr:TIM barrel protein [Stackebrandtia nassauensis]ADD40750.1 Xylose isomerase domain protein TIM barrel [Stackebrandtia nassauensis DSM 44728]